MQLFNVAIIDAHLRHGAQFATLFENAFFKGWTVLLDQKPEQLTDTSTRQNFNVFFASADDVSN